MRWNWYTPFHRLDSHFNQFFPSCRFEKMRTLLAGYTFIGFALLYFPPVTSSPLRGLFLIGWETKQLSCFPFRFALFLFFNFLPTEVATCSHVVLNYLFFNYYYYRNAAAMCLAAGKGDRIVGCKTLSTGASEKGILQQGIVDGFLWSSFILSINFRCGPKPSWLRRHDIKELYS